MLSTLLLSCKNGINAHRIKNLVHARVTTHTHLSEAVPEVIGLSVRPAELFKILNDSLSELLLPREVSVEHQENRSPL